MNSTHTPHNTSNTTQLLPYYSPYYSSCSSLVCLTTRCVLIIPSFRNWSFVLHVKHVSCVIANYGHHQRANAYSSVNIALQALLELVLQNFLIPGYFPYILFYRYLFSTACLCDNSWIFLKFFCAKLHMSSVTLRWKCAYWTQMQLWQFLPLGVNSYKVWRD